VSDDQTRASRLDLQKSAWQSFESSFLTGEPSGGGVGTVLKQIFPVKSFDASEEVNWVEYKVVERAERGPHHPEHSRTKILTLTLQVIEFVRDERRGKKSLKDIREQECVLGQFPVPDDAGYFVLDDVRYVYSAGKYLPTLNSRLTGAFTLALHGIAQAIYSRLSRAPRDREELPSSLIDTEILLNALRVLLESADFEAETLSSRRLLDECAHAAVGLAEVAAKPYIDDSSGLISVPVVLAGQNAPIAYDGLSEKWRTIRDLDLDPEERLFRRIELQHTGEVRVENHAYSMPASGSSNQVYHLAAADFGFRIESPIEFVEAIEYFAEGAPAHVLGQQVSMAKVFSIGFPVLYGSDLRIVFPETIDRHKMPSLKVIEELRTCFNEKRALSIYPGFEEDEVIQQGLDGLALQRPTSSDLWPVFADELSLGGVVDVRGRVSNLDVHHLRIPFCLRLKNRDTSLLYLRLFLSRTKQGQRVLGELLAPWKTPKEFRFRLGQLRLALPSNRCSQVKWALESEALLESCRQIAGEFAEAPAEDLLETQRSRLQLLSKFAATYPAQLEALLVPLPSCLELPYHRYLNAVPGIERIAKAWRYLTLVLRIPTLFAVEYLEHIGCKEIEEFTRALRQRPLTDGKWVEQGVALAALGQARLGPWYPCLHTLFCGTAFGTIKELVSRRNSWVHGESADDRLQERIDTELLPMIMEITSLLRAKLSHVELLRAGTISGGAAPSLTCLRLSGHQGTFETVTREVALSDVENCCEDALLIRSGSAVLPVATYFRCLRTEEGQIDVEVLDKGKKGAFEFMSTLR
jgi:hypothetical protein